MIASDASPLICLAKAGKPYLLRELFEKVMIEEEVKRETIDRGKEEGAPDALIIENAVKEGWIKVDKIEEGKRLKKAVEKGLIGKDDAIRILDEMVTG